MASPPAARPRPAGRLRILDGGLSTQLEHQGVDLSVHGHLWTAGLLQSDEGCDQLRRAHDAFANAGADIILSATYQAHVDVVGEALLFRGIDIVVQAAQAAGSHHVTPWVSMGPYGAVRHDGSEYTGSYGLPPETAVAALRSFHQRQVDAVVRAPRWHEVLARGGGFAFETIPSGDELTAIVEVLRQAPGVDDTPCWLSVQCRRAADGVLLADGTSVAACMLPVLGALRGRCAATYLGINCSDPSAVDPFLDALLALVTGARPDEKGSTGGGPGGEDGVGRGPCPPPWALTGIVVYPNNGGTWHATLGKWLHPDRRLESFAHSRAGRWRDRIWAAGLDAIVGGCCSTDAACVAQLCKCLRQGCGQVAQVPEAGE